MKIKKQIKKNLVEIEFDNKATEKNFVDKALAATGAFGKMSNWSEVESQIKDIESSIETNANEAMQTVLTSYGKELVPLNVLSNQLIDMIKEDTSLLSFLPSNHGRNMAISEKVPVLGEAPFMQKNVEWDGSSTSIAVGTSKVQTAELTINQVPLILSIPLSKRLLNYSVVDIQRFVTDKIVLSGSKTIESAIINADDETGATGNINSDDQAPATTFAASGGANDHRLAYDDGIRKLALSSAINCGTLDRADFTSIENLLGDLFGEECLWLTNRRTYNTIAALSEFTDSSQRGQSSTLNGNAVTNIDGADMYLSKHVPLTEADGKMSGATLANNVKGGLHLVYTPAVQYGWGQAPEIDVVSIPGKGIQIVSTMEFGFTIANQLAGQTEQSVASGINITV